MNRKLIITTQEWAPYHYRLPNGEVGGEATEVVKRVLDEMGIKYEITGSPVKSSDSKVLYAQCQ